MLPIINSWQQHRRLIFRAKPWSLVNFVFNILPWFYNRLIVLSKTLIPVCWRCTLCLICFLSDQLFNWHIRFMKLQQSLFLILSNFIFVIKVCWCFAPLITHHLILTLSPTILIIFLLFFFRLFCFNIF